MDRKPFLKAVGLAFGLLAILALAGSIIVGVTYFKRRGSKDTTSTDPPKKVAEFRGTEYR